MHAQVGAHRLGHAELERVGDQGMADRDLEHARARAARKSAEVGAVQVVAGVDAEARRAAPPRAAAAKRGERRSACAGVPWARA